MRGDSHLSYGVEPKVHAAWASFLLEPLLEGLFLNNANVISAKYFAKRSSAPPGGMDRANSIDMPSRFDLAVMLSAKSCFVGSRS
eukprot:CAMPEP_0172725910 /NCGR_PEP_ID=MMETSP1074-20121228/89536_1 /TAXON_ID=2916 /ORGANISM="Ceratium fusus, Strain PA161109" /LENGTH=84 /DNA_ID=CAMNT_0013552793 /DNA_START=429 /DNA_END=684 /DNA_ORIENTATION=-